MVGRQLVLLLALAAPVFSLWPIPSTLTEGTKGLKLASSFSIELAGALAHSAPTDLHDAGQFVQPTLVLFSYLADLFIQYPELFLKFAMTS